MPETTYEIERSPDRGSSSLLLGPQNNVGGRSRSARLWCPALPNKRSSTTGTLLGESPPGHVLMHRGPVFLVPDDIDMNLWLVYVHRQNLSDRKGLDLGE